MAWQDSVGEVWRGALELCQYSAIRFADWLDLDRAGLAPSRAWSVIAVTNALVESINGLYKTGLIDPGRPWQQAAHVGSVCWSGLTGSTIGVRLSPSVRSRQQKLGSTPTLLTRAQRTAA